MLDAQGPGRRGQAAVPLLPLEAVEVAAGLCAAAVFVSLFAGAFVSLFAAGFEPDGPVVARESLR